MTYTQAVAYLLSLLGDIRGANFGLDRMEALLDQLGRPERTFHSVHIAGTNGKGSTAAMIEAGLRAAGHSTGLFTSPHLAAFNERIRIGGQPISDGEFAEAVGAVRDAIEPLVTAGGRSAHPTMFEVVTAAGFEAFRRAKVDWGVVEVGLGGRLDATNSLHAGLAVITAVGLDHESWLGKGLATIAGEKAGILKPGCRAVFARQEPAAAQTLQQRAAELQVPVIQVGEAWTAADEEPDELGRYRFTARSSSTAIPVRLNLAGAHQIDNALTAIAALAALAVPPAAIQKGLASVEWPGRLELLQGQPDILLDCAHNPSGAAVCANHLRRFYPDRPIRLIYAASRDKALDEVAGALFPLAEEVILTRSSVARSVSPETLAQMLDHHHARLRKAATVEVALRVARESAGDRDLIVVAGSIFLVGEAREFLAGRTAIPVSS